MFLLQSQGSHGAPAILLLGIIFGAVGGLVFLILNTITGGLNQISDFTKCILYSLLSGAVTMVLLGFLVEMDYIYQAIIALSLSLPIGLATNFVAKRMNAVVSA